MQKTANQIARQVIIKVAGYWQNVVGFSDLDNYNTLRDARLALNASEELPDNYREEAQKFNPEALGGEDYGDAGKYVEVPEMVGSYQRAHMSGADTGGGYMGKDDLIDRLDSLLSRKPLFRDRVMSPEYTKLRQSIQDSPHPYFTSTDIR